MKNKRKIFITLILLIVLLSLFSLIFKNPLKPPTTMQEKTTKILDNSTQLESTIALIKQKGFTVIDSNFWSKSSLLNVLLGMCTGSADGYCKQAFFFYNGEYLGTDTLSPSAQINIVWRDDTTIALNYILYNKDDPMCCPTAGAVTVRFQWDGNKLMALDPIPTSDWFADIHR